MALGDILGFGRQQPNIIGGGYQPPPRIPWASNPMVTMAGLSLLGAPTLQQGLQQVAANAPTGMAAKTAMQKTQQDRADADKVKDAWNRFMIAKSAGQPIPPDAQAIIAQANPAIAAKMFDQATGMGDAPNASLVPIWGTGPDGKPMLVQPTDTGKALQTQLPEGFIPSRGIDKMDAGTEWLLIDKQSGQVVGRQPKNVAGEAAQTKVGEAQGEAIATLPSVIGKAEVALQTIDKLKNHPGRIGATGGSAWSSWIPATPEYDFDILRKQAQGQVFLTAYQDLKGGGAITTIEGEKAEQAIARLDRWQSEAEFLQALNDLEEVVKAGLNRAKAKAAGTGQPAATTAPAPAAQTPPAPVSWEEYFKQ